MIDDLVNVLGPIAPEEALAAEAVGEIYGSCRMMLACLPRDMLNKVVVGYNCDFYDVSCVVALTLFHDLFKGRGVRGCAGGRGEIQGSCRMLLACLPWRNMLNHLVVGYNCDFFLHELLALSILDAIDVPT